MRPTEVDEGGAVSETGFVDVDGGRLFYLRDGTGPAVVFAHGAPTLDHRMWADQAIALSDDCTVVRYDLRGYGRSSLPEGSYRHSDDLARLAETLGLNPCVVVGMSFGAAVALDAALAVPRVVSGLILAPLAPLPGWSWVEGFPLASALRLAGSAPTDAVVDAILALPMNDNARRLPRSGQALHDMAHSYSGWHFTHRDPATWVVPDAVDRLRDVAVPTLVITGDQDVLDVRLIANKVVADVGDATHLVLEGVGHNPNLENPEAFNRACLAFLGRLR